MWQGQPRCPSASSVGAVCLLAAWPLLLLSVARGGGLRVDQLAARGSEARTLREDPRKLSAREVAAERLLRGDLEADDSLAEEEQQDRVVFWMVQSFQLVMFVVGTIAEGLTVLIYWRCFIQKSPDLYVPKGVVVPEDLQGRWRAGWLHALHLDCWHGCPCPCVGWEYLLGICCYLSLEGTLGPCMPCGLAMMRGGVKWADDDLGGEVVPYVDTFRIPNKGFCTFVHDSCCWCWCAPCIGTQEYRQIMALLQRAPLRVHPDPRAQPGAVVGNWVHDPDASPGAYPVVGRPVTVVAEPQQKDI